MKKSNNLSWYYSICSFPLKLMIYHLWLFCRWGIRHHPNPELRMTLALLRWRLDLTKVLFKNFITLIKQYLNGQLPFVFIHTYLVVVWKARMRLGGCRTRVRRDPTLDAVSDAVDRVSMLRLSLLLLLFFFFFFLGFAPNWADSARIGPYWPATEMAKTDRNGQNRPKLALNLAGTIEILISECFLPFSFFVLWIKDSNVFFNNILIVKIYRKYK